MNSKEALEKIKMFVSCNHPQESVYLCETEEYKIIKNTLEVLDILKSKKYIPLGELNPKHWLEKDVYNKIVTYKYYLYLCEEECEYFVSENEKLTKEEFIKIIRWLNNNK